MKNRIVRELVEHNFCQAENSNNSQILYQVMDEGVYMVSIYELPKGQIDLDVTAYRDYIRKIKWNFINQGYRNIEVLHIVIANNTEGAKPYIEGNDSYWIINSEEGQLIIYENQRPQFLDVKNCIEEVLRERFDRISYKDALKRKLNKISNSANSIRNRIVTLCIIGINIIVFLIMDWSFDASTYNTFITQGGMSYKTVITNHQYYRLLTGIFIHSDINHIFGNMIVLYFIGKEIEKRLGAINYLLLYFLGGIVADCTSLGYNKIYDQTVISIGASGAIFAIVGAMIAIVIWNKAEFEDIGIQRLIFFVIITIANGITTTGIDNAAHIGGLIGGAVVGYRLYQKKQYKTNKLVR